MHRFPKSYSRISSYIKCPKMFQFSTDKDTKKLGTVSPPMLIGRAVHDAVQGYLNQRAKLDGPDLDLAMTLAKTHAARQQPSLSEGDVTDVVFMMRQFAEWEPFDVSQKAKQEAEWSFNADLNPCAWMAEDVLIRAKVDRHWFPANRMVDGKPTAIVIDDWKTGRSIVPDMDQLRFYFYLASLLWPTLREASVRNVFLRTKQEFAYGMTKGDTEEAELWWTKWHTRIENDRQFLPTPGSHCTFCNWAHLCDVHKTLPLVTPGQELIALCQAEAFVKARKANLKALLLASPKTGMVIEQGNARAEIVRQGQTRVVDPVRFLPFLKRVKDCSSDQALFNECLSFLSIDNKALDREFPDPVMQDLIEDLSERKGGYDKLVISKMDKNILLVEPPETKQVPVEAPQVPALPPSAPKEEKPAETPASPAAGGIKAPCPECKQQTMALKATHRDYVTLQCTGCAHTEEVSGADYGEFVASMEEANEREETGDLCGECKYFAQSDDGEVAFYCMEGLKGPGGQIGVNPLDDACKDFVRTKEEITESSRHVPRIVSPGDDLVMELKGNLDKALKRRGVFDPTFRKAFFYFHRGKATYRASSVSELRTMLASAETSSKDEFAIVLAKGNELLEAKNNEA